MTRSSSIHSAPGNEPGEPLDKNIYELPPEELKKVPNVPGSLGEALDHLEKDNAFLLKGDVFTSDFIEMWITHKRKEHDALRLLASWNADHPTGTTEATFDPR